MVDATRPNEFLVRAFDDRQVLLEAAMANHSTEQIRNLIIGLKQRSETNKNERFQNILDTVIACVAFKRLCGGGVGKWMTDHCQNLDERVRASITERCKFSAAIFMKWDIIVHNLTNSEMKVVDARDFTLRKLYNATNPGWCNRERKQNVGPGATKPPPAVVDVQEYDEILYRNIMDNITNSGILRNVNFDPVQAELIADRIKVDLHKLCDEARGSS